MVAAKFVVHALVVTMVWEGLSGSNEEHLSEAHPERPSQIFQHCLSATTAPKPTSGATVRARW
jgi:hypothetical protein